MHCKNLNKMENNPVFDKNTVEFVTVAAEYCAFIVKSVKRRGVNFWMFFPS